MAELTAINDWPCARTIVLSVKALPPLTGAPAPWVDGRRPMLFSDRTDAGRQLAARLGHYRGKDPVVLALPRGGVPVAAEIATALSAPLDLVLVRKLGFPGQPELAMGAIAEGSQSIIVRSEGLLGPGSISEAMFQQVCESELAEIARRKARYLGARPRAKLSGRPVIVVDDGIATGATMSAALQSIRQHRPGTVVLAVPVAPAATLVALREEADEVICLDQPEPFYAIGQFYRNFGQVSDEEVVAILARFPPGDAPEPRRSAI